MMAIKVAGYARVSTDEQARDGLSIEGQIESIKKYCALYNDKYNIDFYIDKGFTGRNMQRKNLRLMLSNIHDYDQLIVWKLDRLSRSLSDSVLIIDDIIEKDVALISIEEKIDCSTPTGRAFINIIMTFAQLEVESISERTKLGLLQKARNGSYPFSVLPYGYLLNDDRKLVPDESTKQLINIIYQKYFKDKINPNKICYELNKMYPNYTRKQMEKIVHRVLKNRIYIGEFSYQGEIHPDVIAQPVVKDKFYKNLVYKAPQHIIHTYESFTVYCSCGMKLHNTTVTKSGRTYKYKCCSRCNKRINEKKIRNLIYYQNISQTNNELNNSKKVRYVYDFQTKKINTII